MTTPRTNKNIDGLTYPNKVNYGTANSQRRAAATPAPQNISFDPGIVDDYTVLPSNLPELFSFEVDPQSLSNVPSKDQSTSYSGLALDEMIQNQYTERYNNTSQQPSGRSPQQLHALQNRLKGLKQQPPSPVIAHKPAPTKRPVAQPVLDQTAHLPTTFAKPQSWSPELYQNVPPKKSKKSRTKSFSWTDYSLSFVLLIISVALGFNLTFQYNEQLASANFLPAVAGVRDRIAPNKATSEEDTNDSIQREDATIDVEQRANEVSEDSITQAEFEIWMNEFYPEQSKAPETAPLPASETNVLELFGVSSLNEVNDLQVNESEINSKISSAQRKNDYLTLSKKIDSYIATYRSYDVYDNQLASPLNGLTYIAVSEQTGMPLKYMLAISRAESRFGTDRFLASGNLSRPGQYLNACSIGLDDSGGNIGFASWEEGLEACGKWYQYFESRGVPDCRKWGIFNPNGDYCSKIETLANEINSYLN